MGMARTPALSLRSAVLTTASRMLLVACPGDDGSSGDETGSTGDPGTTSTTRATNPTTEGTTGSSTTSDASTGDTTGTAETGDVTSSSSGGSSSGSSRTTGGGCPEGELMCDEACVDPNTSPDYCGASDDCVGENAGAMCSEDQECDEGICAWTDDGWVYLAVVLDLFSRRVVGGAIADHMRTELVLDALDRALSTRDVDGADLVHHSDRGSQYASDAFTTRLQRAGVKWSMGATGCCYDATTTLPPRVSSPP